MEDDIELMAKAEEKEKASLKTELKTQKNEES